MLCRFHEHVDFLNVSATDLYNALLADAELQPPNWDLQGRQANIWKLLGTNRHLGISAPLDKTIYAGYIPSDIFETSGTNTKQVSRTLEVLKLSYREACRMLIRTLSMPSVTSPYLKWHRS